MIDKPLAFVDVETTGASYQTDRIIEIGILRVEDGQLTKTYNQLINPDRRIPPQITRITGIQDVDLEDSPQFNQLKHDIQELLEDAILVAHNARFDYGFLRAEFKRHNLKLTNQSLCTVRLSRALYPRFKRHGLDALIKRFNFPVNQRHRAFDDAKVLWDFYQHILNTFEPDSIKPVLDKILKRPSLPPHIKPSLINQLPETPGVYTFYNQDQAPLYIGKSINVKDRVRSHFTATLSSQREQRIASQTHHVDAISTAGDLGAQLLESRMVKELQPIHNRQLRRQQKLIALTKKFNPDHYLTLNLTDIQPEEFTLDDSLVTVFRSHSQAKKVLQQLAQEHQLCPKLMGLETGSGSCFAYHLEECSGACLQKEIPARYNLRLTQALTGISLITWPFSHLIAVRESFEDRTDYHLFHHWCHLDSITAHKELLTELKPETLNLKPHSFSLDTYKILARFLKKKSAHRHIIHLTPND